MANRLQVHSGNHLSPIGVTGHVCPLLGPLGAYFSPDLLIFRQTCVFLPRLLPPQPPHTHP